MFFTKWHVLTHDISEAKIRTLIFPRNKSLISPAPCPSGISGLHVGTPRAGLLLGGTRPLQLKSVGVEGAISLSGEAT